MGNKLCVESLEAIYNVSCFKNNVFLCVMSVTKENCFVKQIWTFAHLFLQKKFLQNFQVEQDRL